MMRDRAILGFAISGLVAILGPATAQSPARPAQGPAMTAHDVNTDERDLVEAIWLSQLGKLEDAEPILARIGAEGRGLAAASLPNITLPKLSSGSRSTNRPTPVLNRSSLSIRAPIFSRS